MPPTDTSEAGLESLIFAALTGGVALPEAGAVAELAPLPGQPSNFYLPGDWRDYDRDFAVDPVQLFAFLAATQPAALFKSSFGIEGLLPLGAMR